VSVMETVSPSPTYGPAAGVLSHRNFEQSASDRGER
jgi:hypothetical protein